MAKRKGLIHSEYLSLYRILSTYSDIDQYTILEVENGIKRVLNTEKRKTNLQDPPTYKFMESIAEKVLDHLENNRSK